MTICVTRKLATSIKLNARHLPSAPTDAQQRWYANLIRAERIKYMLVTDAATLLSVVFAGKGITNPSSFASAAAAAIREYFGYRGWSEVLDVFDADPTAAEFTKTDDRRILGSMNDFRLQLKWLVNEPHKTQTHLSDLLNQNPMSYLGGSSPEWLVQDFLAERRRLSASHGNAE